LCTVKPDKFVHLLANDGVGGAAAGDTAAVADAVNRRDYPMKYN